MSKIPASCLHAVHDTTPAAIMRISRIREELHLTADRLSRLVDLLRDHAGDLSGGMNLIAQDEMDRRELDALRLLFRIAHEDSPDTI